MRHLNQEEEFCAPDASKKSYLGELRELVHPGIIMFFETSDSLLTNESTCDKESDRNPRKFAARVLKKGKDYWHPEVTLLICHVILRLQDDLRSNHGRFSKESYEKLNLNNNGVLDEATVRSFLEIGIKLTIRSVAKKLGFVDYRRNQIPVDHTFFEQLEVIPEDNGLYSDGRLQERLQDLLVAASKKKKKELYGCVARLISTKMYGVSPSDLIEKKILPKCLLEDQIFMQSFEKYAAPFLGEEDVDETFIIARAEVLASAQDIGRLWNEAERAESSANGRFATEVVVAFPHHFDRKARRKLAEQFARPIVKCYGVAAQISIKASSKDGDEHNHHAHILFTHRELGSDGFMELSKARTAPNGKLAANPADVVALRKEWERVVNRASGKIYSKRYRTKKALSLLIPQIEKRVLGD